ncbi:hypothetical protein BOX15_Mlig000318g3 [Macrostomum lignano]|uniref:Transglutaminase-like domain-containing protein n=1 Tax=Macrostomum lignano TaxID=282301 RepID=A0A267G2J3_9PLAT|nr:hypothetical protein BOX15_Mlig000318g3 [Macrostomum lignano]
MEAHSATESATAAQQEQKPKSYLDELPYYSNYQLADDEVPLAKYLLPADSAEVQRGVESGRFPTLSGLARLQRQRGQPPNPLGDAANESPPAPFPPRRTKTELLESKDFTETDKFAESVTPLPSDDWEQLAERLFEQSRSNLEKVRVAFCFACAHRQLAEVAEETPAYKAIRENEATDVFEKLLGCGKVPNKKLYGYKKGADSDSGVKAELGGCWFACYVEGEWRFVDPHWGATAVMNHDSGRYGSIDDKGRVSSAREQKGQSVFYRDEFHFLTDPERLITNHCPQQHDLEWQLLARPLSIEEFELFPRYFGGSAIEMEFYDLEPINYPYNVIVAKPGPVEILLKERSGEQYRYSGQLKIHKKHINSESKTAILSAHQEKACISKGIRVSKDTVKFIFEPPYPGQYALEIILWRQVSEVTLTGCKFLTYTIHCPQNWESVDVIPEGQENLREFGPGQDLQRAGLTSEAPGELKAADGEASLEIAPLDEDEKPSSDHLRSLTCQALGPDNKPLPTGSVLVWRDDRRNAFLFLAPDSGYYALVLYENGRPVGQFLVDASSEAKDGASFPLPDWSRVGGLGLAAVNKADGGGCRLVPLSHQTPYVRTEEFELAMRFGVDGAGEEGDAGIELKSEMLGVGADGGTESVGDYSLVSGVEGGGFEVRCRFPRAGHYLLRLSFRESGGDWRPYFTYFVRAVGQLDGSASAFPSLGADWPVGGALIEPLDRTLSVGQPTPICLRLVDSAAIGAVEVVDERSGSREPLSRDPQDPRLWFGSVTASAGNTDGANAAGSGGVTVVARVNDGVETQLVKFDVESGSSAEAKAAALREARELNERRRVAEENRQRKRENRRRHEEGLEPLPTQDSLKKLAEAEAAAKAAAEAEAAAKANAASNKTFERVEVASKKSTDSKAASNEAVKAASRAESAGQAVTTAGAAVEAAVQSAAEAARTAAEAAKSGEVKKAAKAAKLAETAALEAKSAAQAAVSAATDARTAAKASAEAEQKAKTAAEAARNEADQAAVEAEKSGNDQTKKAAQNAATLVDEAEAKLKTSKEASEKAAAEADAASKKAAKASSDSEAASKSLAEANAAATTAAEAAAAAKAAEAEAAAAAKEEVKLLISQLDEALLSRKVVQLRKAIKALEPHEFGLHRYHERKLREARLTLTALQNRKDIRDAMADAQRARSTDRLRALVHRLEAEAESQPLTEAQLALFSEDLRLAREAIQRDDKLKRIPSHRLEMSPKSLSELRQYSRPVETVHRTVQALLLLLGYYEKRTRKWPRCQPLLKSINKSVADFQPRFVDPRIAARSSEILSSIDKREIALQSAAAFAFYEWAVKTANSIKEASTPETFVPASMKQQILILGVTEEEDATWDFDDEGIRRRSSVVPK